MSNLLSNRYKQRVYASLHEVKADYEFRKLLGQFVNIYLHDISWINDNNTKLTSSKISFAMEGFQLLFNIIDGLSIKSNNIRSIVFSWRSYCSNVHKINELYYKNKKNHRVIFYVRKLLKKLYKYIVKNATYETTGLKELKENIRLLDIGEKPTSKRAEVEWPLYIHEKVRTNFPLNSKPEELYIYEYDAPKASGNKKIYTTLYLKRTSRIVRELLIDFIESFPKEKGVNIKPSLIQYRQFFYHFGDSLYAKDLSDVQNKISSIQSFNNSVFKKQYRFYKKIDTRYYLLSPRKNEYSKYKVQTLTDILKEFYVFLLNKIEEEGIDHNPFQGTGINKKILHSYNFKVDYESGYLFVYRTGIEKIPERDRWSIFMNNRANSGIGNLKRFDFTTIIDKELKQCLKEFLWYEKSISVNYLYTEFTHLRDFLNFKVEYENEVQNIIMIDSRSKDFSEELILLYRVEIIARYQNDENSIWQAFAAVKKFLKFVDNKYEIPAGIHEYLSLKHRSKKYGGNPIRKEDFSLIKEGIRELNNGHENDTLYYIIFNLKATTQLRIGEILNLQRNCIIAINENGGTGEIKHYSKTYGNKKKKTTLTLDKIMLIEKAKELTSKLAIRTKDKEKRFIFIKESNRLRGNFENISISRINSNDVSIYFKEILEKKGIEKSRYSVNHLRHTFKDTIWREGISKGISTLQLEHMTGSTFGTDVHHYRAKKNVQNYAEIFSGVSISDVNIKGEIVSEDTINKLNPVEKGAGACKHDGCIKIKSEREKMYKCLVCESFVTTVSRKEMFKKRIQDFKEKREKAVSINEKNYYESELKLNTAYYSSLIDMLNGG